MHNKLFIADGTMAVVGGRNIAEEYFVLSEAQNFIDMDAVAVGRVVPQLEAIFDNYWNSEQVWPIGEIVRGEGGEGGAAGRAARVASKALARATLSPRGSPTASIG